jgi:hypothetical protein
MARTKKARSAAARQARSQQKSGSQDSTVDFAHEYRYVVGDLRRVAILAAAMFALLVILAVALP